VFLSRCPFVFEDMGEPLELSLKASFTSLPVTSRAMAPFEDSFAPAAHEDSGVLSIAPLMLTRLLGRMPLSLSYGRCFLDKSTFNLNRQEAYMMVPSSSEEDDWDD
jgi:hypothetical protein